MVEPVSPDNPFKDVPGVGDFFAPFFRVKFLRLNKSAIPVGPDVGPVPQQVGMGLGFDEFSGFEKIGGRLVATDEGHSTGFTEDTVMSQLRNYATSLTIEQQGEGFSRATLTVEPPFYEAARIIDEGVIQQNAIMVCRWGWLPPYPGATAIQSEEHYFCLQPPQLELTTQEARITIVGTDVFSTTAICREDRACFARTGAARARAFQTRVIGDLIRFVGTRQGSMADVIEGTFENDLQILEYLARKNNMDVNVALVPTDSTLFQTRPFQDEPDMLEQYEPDWLLFRRLCYGNKCNYFTRGKTIYVVGQTFVKVQKAAYNLVMFQQPQTDRDVPLYEFSTKANVSLFQPTASKEVRHVSADPDSGVHDMRAVDPSAMPDNPVLGVPRTMAGISKALADGRAVQVSGGVTLIPNPEFAPSETGRTVSTPRGVPNRDEKVNQLARQAAFVANTEAEATIPGVPGITPQMVVRVSGVSKKFSGCYLVLGVTHTVGNDYTSKLKLIRDTSTGDAAGEGAQPTGGASNPEVQESGGGDAPEENADGEGT